MVSVELQDGVVMDIVWPIEGLEIRQAGRSLSGSFRYGSTATVRDRGRVRKERFAPRAFSHAVEDEEREINLLSGHTFAQPLASKQRGSLRLSDSDDSLDFEATLPPENDQPSWMRDAVLAVRGGLINGISPGFRVPPASAVANAVTLIPEPGNPGVSIRLIRQALLYELSLVTRPAYPDTALSLRADEYGKDTDFESLYRLL